MMGYGLSGIAVVGDVREISPISGSAPGEKGEFPVVDGELLEADGGESHGCEGSAPGGLFGDLREVGEFESDENAANARCHAAKAGAFLEDDIRGLVHVGHEPGGVPTEIALADEGGGLAAMIEPRAVGRGRASIPDGVGQDDFGHFRGVHADDGNAAAEEGEHDAAGGAAEFRHDVVRGKVEVEEADGLFEFEPGAGG